MRLMSSVLLPDHIEPVSSVIIFKELTKNFNPVVAMERPFFMGVKIYKDETDPVGTVICEPAMTEVSIMERLKDPRFCSKCFMFECHAYDCEKSPWKNFSQ